MSFLCSLRTWLLFNNKINPQKYNLPNNSALPVHLTVHISHLCEMKQLDSLSQ